MCFKLKVSKALMMRKKRQKRKEKITAAFSHFIVPNDVKKIRRIVKKAVKKEMRE